MAQKIVFYQVVVIFLGLQQGRRWGWAKLAFTSAFGRKYGSHYAFHGL